MAFTAEDVKNLREQTGAGMMDCKKALTESDGNIEKAIDWLRLKGLATAQKKSSRVASQGQVNSYIHMGGKIGVLVEVNCESDFVAKTDEFSAFVRDVAMHIAASSPLYVRPEEVPQNVIAHEKELYLVQAKESGKPEKVWEKMVEGKLNKFFQEVCLIEQPFVKDPDKTVDQYTKDTIAKIGENIVIRRFARFKLGEGIEKKQDDLAAEVQKQIDAAANKK